MQHEVVAFVKVQGAISFMELLLQLSPENYLISEIHTL